MFGDNFSRAALIGAVFSGVFAHSALAVETKSYVVSWIVPAMYSHEGDCSVIEPVAEPGHTPVDTMFRKFLVEMGNTPEESNVLVKELNVDPRNKILNMVVMRGRVDG